ncbi:hypothetical protein BDW22DRAFT_1433768 [Trametopsis cervina]|nr:hypothetical protein BDW22DRAFT_1433768 [Trametopsis cervina]
MKCRSGDDEARWKCLAGRRRNGSAGFVAWAPSSFCTLFPHHVTTSLHAEHITLIINHPKTALSAKYQARPGLTATVVRFGGWESEREGRGRDICILTPSRELIPPNTFTLSTTPVPPSTTMSTTRHLHQLKKDQRRTLQDTRAVLSICFSLPSNLFQSSYWRSRTLQSRARADPTRLELTAFKR